MQSFHRRDFFNASLALFTLPSLSALNLMPAADPPAPLDPSKLTAAQLRKAVGADIDPLTFYPGIAGDIRFVTTTKLDGPGSLTAACKKPNGIVFILASGVFDLGGQNLRIEQRDITITGVKAPGPVVFTRGGIHVEGQNIRLSHLAVYPGDNDRKKAGWAPDGITVTGKGTKYVLLDHITAAMGIDENGDTGWKVQFGPEDAPRDILIYRCAFGQPLRNAGHPGNKPHDCNFLQMDWVTGVEYVETLFYRGRVRNPMLKGNTTALMRGCVVQDWEKEGVQLHPVPSEYTDPKKCLPPILLVQDTVFIPGPNTDKDSRCFIGFKDGPKGRLFLSGATLFNGKDGVGQVTAEGPLEIVGLGGKQFLASMTLAKTKEVVALVYTKAGAHPLARDPYAAALFKQAVMNHAKPIDSPSQNAIGGYPVLVENVAQEFNVPGDKTSRLKMMQDLSTAAEMKPIPKKK